MKYITSVRDRSGLKHIVEVSGQNLEVIESPSAEQYGNMKGHNYFTYGELKIYTDYSFKPESSSNAFHLASVVFAIELVRFVVEELKASHKGSN